MKIPSASGSRPKPEIGPGRGHRGRHCRRRGRDRPRRGRQPTGGQDRFEGLQGRPAEIEPAELLRKVFNEANKNVYDASMQTPKEGRMATTLTVSIFRNDEISIGHVGDSRVYLIRNGGIRRLTADHSYVALQVKLGLVKERDAMASPMRSMITRSIGQDLMCGYDVFKETLAKGDVLVQCTDGLYSVVLDDEICDVAGHLAPEEACAAVDRAGGKTR